MNCPECGKDQERVRTHWEGCHEHHPECAAYKSGYEAGKKDGVEAGLRRAAARCEARRKWIQDEPDMSYEADGAMMCRDDILSAIGGGK